MLNKPEPTTAEWIVEEVLTKLRHEPIADSEERIAQLEQTANQLVAEGYAAQAVEILSEISRIQPIRNDLHIQIATLIGVHRTSVARLAVVLTREPEDTEVATQFVDYCKELEVDPEHIQAKVAQRLEHARKATERILHSTNGIQAHSAI